MDPTTFPSNLPTAPLSRISLAKLLIQDPKESHALLKASIEHGFFFLDLTESAEGQQLLQDVDEAFEMGKRFFAEDIGVKKAFTVNSGNVGYKPLGAIKFQDGTSDLTEICAVSKDSIMNTSIADIPRVHAERREFLQGLVQQLHPIAMLLLRALGEHLQIPADLLMQYHDFIAPSATVLRFLHNPPQSAVDRQASLIGHTDSGSVTILFPTVGGLQIMPSDRDENSEDGWLWVKPEPGCAVVNLGDPMVQWTGGILRSAFHRVLYTPSPSVDEDRYSFGYFLKPADLAPMQRIQEGDVIPKHSVEDPEVDLPLYDHWHQNKTRKIMCGSNAGVSRGGTARFAGPTAITA